MTVTYKLDVNQQETCKIMGNQHDATFFNVIQWLYNITPSCLKRFHFGTCRTLQNTAMACRFHWK